MISINGHADVKSILEDMRKATNWRGRGAYGAPSIPDVATFSSLMRLQDEIDKRNNAHYDEFPILGQKAVRIKSPELNNIAELQDLNNQAKASIRKNQPYEDKRDRMVEIMQKIIEDYEAALKAATAL